MMSAVYREIFEPTNILAGFRKAGLWPVNPDAIINAGMPLNGESSRTLCSVEDLSNMMKMKRQKLADGIGLQKVKVSSGFLESTHGKVLTQAECIEAQRYAEIERKKKRRVAHELVTERQRKGFARQEKKKQKEAAEVQRRREENERRRKHHEGTS